MIHPSPSRPLLRLLAGLLLLLLLASSSAAAAPSNATTVIRHIALLGERNSGTNWLTAELGKAFGLPVKVCFCGFKHFWQYPCRTFKDHDATLVVVVARNPYE